MLLGNKIECRLWCRFTLSFFLTPRNHLIMETDLNYSCTTAEEAFNLSKICVESSDPPEVCFPEIISVTGSLTVGVWCSVHAVIGSVGNLLTLTAIPYAIKHKRLAANIVESLARWSLVGR